MSANSRKFDRCEPVIAAGLQDLLPVALLVESLELGAGEDEALDVAGDLAARRDGAAQSLDGSLEFPMPVGSENVLSQIRSLHVVGPPWNSRLTRPVWAAPFGKVRWGCSVSWRFA